MGHWDVHSSECCFILANVHSHCLPRCSLHDSSALRCILRFLSRGTQFSACFWGEGLSSRTTENKVCLVPRSRIKRGPLTAAVTVGNTPKLYSVFIYSLPGSNQLCSHTSTFSQLATKIKQGSTNHMSRSTQGVQQQTSCGACCTLNQWRFPKDDKGTSQ